MPRMPVRATLVIAKPDIGISEIKGGPNKAIGEIGRICAPFFQNRMIPISAPTIPVLAKGIRPALTMWIASAKPTPASLSSRAPHT